MLVGLGMDFFVLRKMPMMMAMYTFLFIKKLLIMCTIAEWGRIDSLSCIFIDTA
jgi:hypothetical protein